VPPIDNRVLQETGTLKERKGVARGGRTNDYLLAGNEEGTVPKYDIMIIGHITSDILDYKGEVSGFIGGGAYFSAFAAKRSNVNFCVVTKLAKKDFGILEGLKKEGIEVTAIPSLRTTSIENVFETDDVDRRKVRLLSQADPFNPEDIPNVETRIYYLAGVFAGEIPDSLIVHLSKKGEIALDLQAKLRWSESGEFAFKDWAEKGKYIPMVTYLKADSLESEVTTGTPDRVKAAKILHGLGAKEVMITHSSEVVLYNGERLFGAPFSPSNLPGRTGRGDTCFSSYVSWRLTHGIEESLRFAAALTSMKMEKPGPFLGRLEDVFARMKTL
jgi:sugar/nucleoside kinase (ribokinase family)